MITVRWRFVLGVSLLSCLAALVVASTTGSQGRGGEASAAVSSAAPSKDAQLAPPSGSGDVASLRSEFSRSYPQSDGSTRTMIEPASKSVSGDAVSAEIWAL